ncbi:ankyrin repeat domain-containing protein [Oceanithermus desulfurans]
MQRLFSYVAAGLLVVVSTVLANPGEGWFDPRFWRDATPEGLEQLLAEGARLDLADDEGRTPLHLAARYADAAALRVLLEHWRDRGMDMDPLDDEGLTPLLTAAAYRSDGEGLRLLVSFGADLEHRNDVGETPLHLAARVNPELEAMRALIELGADREAEDDDGWTPLLSAASSGRADKIALLLALGVRVDPRATDGASALHLAASSAPDDEAVRQLLQAGLAPDLSDDGWTPLHAAAAFNRSEGVTDVLAALLGAGASLDVRNAIGETPLHVAARMGERPEAVAAFLLSRGADVAAVDDDGWTPLHGAATAGNAGVARMLVVAGAEVDARDHRSFTPLLLLADWGGGLETARTLVDLGADIRARDRWRRNVLHLAVVNADPEDLEAWLKLGAVLEERSSTGETPLHVAARLGDDPEVLRSLVRLGAELEARDGDGWTPFLSAARAGASGNLRALAEMGADVNARSKLGRNALHLAAQYASDEAVINLLVELGVEAAVTDAAGAYPWNLLMKNPDLADTDLAVGLYPIGLHPEER